MLGLKLILVSKSDPRDINPNRACHPDSHYCDFHPGVLPLHPSHSNSLIDSAPKKSMGAWSSNALQRPNYMIVYQDISPAMPTGRHVPLLHTRVHSLSELINMRPPGGWNLKHGVFDRRSKRTFLSDHNNQFCPVRNIFTVRTGSKLDKIQVNQFTMHS